MGIDLNKMRAKHAALTNRGGDSSENFWKPDEGTHQLRLVCPPSGDPFFEAYYHYGMGAEGKTTVLSPRTTGGADPIAEWGTRLWNEGTEGSKEAAKRFWPKMRVFAPVVVRGEEDKGVRWWGFSRTTYQALLDVVMDPEYGDVTDTEKGTDLRIEYGKKSGQVATYETCEKVLNDTLGDTEVTTTSETTRYGNNTNNDTSTNTAKTTTTNKGMEAVADIDSAFDDLLA